ncbi:hypothetical protein BGZ97_010263, partial [Linnemannia gamsii]
MSKSVNYRIIMFSYVSWDQDEYRLSRSSVSYVGEFDDQGRPHGLGEWTDHTFTGEALQGFGSMVYQSDPSKVRNTGLEMPLATSGSDSAKTLDKNDSAVFKAARDPNGPSYGAAAVECSVSG